MENPPHRTAKSIRMDEESYYAARVASVSTKKTLGEWLEEAIKEKIEREQESSK